MPLLARTIQAFDTCVSVDEIIVVASDANLDRCWKLADRRFQEGRSPAGAAPGLVLQGLAQVDSPG
jgi:2-C-methyl-D-erythritol 4-phosphate cytidylyltransferase